MGDVNQFLDRYNQLLTNIDEVNSTLDNAKNINTLNVTDAILECVKSFKDMKSIDRFNLSKEEITDIDKKNDEIKDKIIKLKNKQIYKYNLKVEELNEKIKLLKSVSSLGVEEDIKELEILKWCNIHIYNDWQRNNYKDKLDYDMLQEVSDRLSLIYKKYNLKQDEPVDLTIKLNYYTQLLEDTKKELKEDTTLVEVRTLLDKCIDIYGNIISIDLASRMYLDDAVIEKELYSRYNHQTTQICNDIDKFMYKLLDKKKDVDDKSNDYTLLVDKLELLELKTNKLEEEINRYHGVCSYYTLNKIRIYLRKFDKTLKEVNKEANEITLNSEQKKRLLSDNGKIEYVKSLLSNTEKRINEDPYILGGHFEFYIENCMKQLDEDTAKLQSILNITDKKIKKERKREQLNLLINKIKNDIIHIDTLLAKVGNVQLKNELNKKEETFNKVCREYNSRTPLLVKKVKPANSVYKKYKKECLQVSGLSSSALLDNQVLVPTIMHGNIVLEQKMPSLRGFTNFVNNVLGGVINAKRNEKGEWSLSNGYKIGPAIACTSLLKNMAISKSKLVSSSLVQKVRGLMTKIQIKSNQNDEKVNENNSGRGRR